MNRRRFLRNTSILVGTLPFAQRAFGAESISTDLRERIHGLLLGSMIGDALGGPVEFQNQAAIQQLENSP